MTRRVLIVDDERLNRELLAGLLESIGLEIEEASDGQEAIEKLSAREPDLVLLDVMMPRLGGIETLRRIRARPDAPWVPIILVTADNDRDVRLSGLDAGADEFLEKPIDRAMLLARVNTLLRLREALDRLAERTRLLEDLTVLDECTSLYNSRYLSRILPAEVERARRFHHPLSLLFVDLDHFKNVNDTHGHAAGTAMLVEVARMIRSALRTVDIPVRYGGDEFVILLPETGKQAAIDVALRLRERFTARTPGPGVAGPLTASIGLATIPEDAHAGEDLLKAADAAMYLVKTSTRNAVAAAGLGVIER